MRPRPGGGRRALPLALAAVAVLALAAWMRPGFTPPLSLAGDGGGIAVLEPVTLGGLRQWITIRGKDRSAPVVLMLLGEPGEAQIAWARGATRPLEDGFVVVNWDRQGAGKSYAEGQDPAFLRTSREVDDAAALIGRLRSRLGVRRVIIVGQGYGSYLGVALARAHPELVQAYVGAGQAACSRDDEHAIQDSWLKARSEAANAPAVFAKAAAGGEWDRRDALFRYGGAVRAAHSDAALALSPLTAPEYRLDEALAAGDGAPFAAAHFVRDGPDLPLARSVPALDVPAFFFIGDGDQLAPGICTERYAASLRAPAKGVIRFARSAHYPFIEEPARFRAELIRIAAATADRR